MDMFNKLKKVQENIDELRRQMQDRFKEEFKPAIREWLGATPEIESIRWRQYTPWFNDGDPCTFRISDIYYKPVAGALECYEGEEDGDYEDGYISPYSFQSHPELEKKLRELTKLLYSFEDTLEVVFGDHVMVTVNSEEIEVEEYEHD